MLIKIDNHIENRSFNRTKKWILETIEDQLERKRDESILEYIIEKMPDKQTKL